MPYHRSWIKFANAPPPKLSTWPNAPRLPGRDGNCWNLIDACFLCHFCLCVSFMVVLFLFVYFRIRVLAHVCSLKYHRWKHLFSFFQNKFCTQKKINKNFLNLSQTTSATQLKNFFYSQITLITRKCFSLSQVDSSYDAGDYAGALRNANIARWLNLASIICGIVLIVILFSTRVST